MDLRLLESHSAELPSLPDGIFYGQYESHNYINEQIFQRNLADTPLKPLFDFRSLPTRNTLYPMLDNRLKYKPRDFEKYDVENIFAPINSKGPIEGFRVDDESKLHNQYFALQRGADQGVYVPSSNSDLYKVTLPESGNKLEQPFPNLFHVPKMTTDIDVPKFENLGKLQFHNDTRMQLKNILN